MRYEFRFSGCLLAGTLSTAGSIEQEDNGMAHAHERRGP